MSVAILELITIGAKIFSDERKRYYENKSAELVKKIQEVEDSDFYKKDMEAKGKAERDLIMQVEDLRKQFIMEATK